jgi:phasin family protein
MMEGFLGTARKTADCLEQQSAEVTEKSISLTRETLNFVQRAMHVREPHNLLHLHSEFMGKQAELLADQSKQLVESFTRGANEVRRATSQGLAEASRRSSKAA